MSEEGTERLLSDCVGCRILRAELTEARREYEGPMAEEIAEAHAAIRTLKEALEYGRDLGPWIRAGGGTSGGFRKWLERAREVLEQHAPVIRRAMGEGK